MRSSLSSLGVAGVMAACLVSGSAFAYATGNVGYSGKQSTTTTCMGSGCHSGGTAPTVTLEGPDTLAPGATGNYSLVIKGGAATRGGFNVAVDTGTLNAGSGQRKEGGELTHSQSKAFANNEVRFDFTLVAPATAGSIKLFGAGNSTNGNQQETGDASALAPVKTITVAAGGGDGGGDDEGGCAAAGSAPLLGAVLMLVGARLRRRR
ncbi:MXAN_6652 family MXYO-CTERM-anchored protein [Pyxidicoccus sp. 3LFB2]